MAKQKPTAKQPEQPKTPGRPKKVVSVSIPELVSKWAQYQMPKTDLCTIIGISVDTFDRDPVLRAIYAKEKESGRASLRAKQMDLALSGDKTMLIWLGKQYLGQRETQSVELSGPDKQPLAVDVKQVFANPELTDLAERLAIASSGLASINGNDSEFGEVDSSETSQTAE